MRITPVAADVNVAADYPHRGIPAAAFNTGAAVGLEIARGTEEIGRLYEKKAAQDAQAEAIFLQSQAELALQNHDAALKQTETSGPAYLEQRRQAFRDVMQQISGQAKNPGSARLLKNHMASQFVTLDRQALTHASDLSKRSEVAQLASTIENYRQQLATKDPVNDSGEIARLNGLIEAAIKIRAPSLGVDEAEKMAIAEGRKTTEELAYRDSHNDPGGFLSRVDSYRAGPNGKRGMDGKALDQLVTGAYTRIDVLRRQAQADEDRAETRKHKQFTEWSAEGTKDYIARARASSIPAEFDALSSEITENRENLTKPDYLETLAHVDSLKKARTAGESDQTVLTNVTQLVDTRKITTLGQLNSYAASLAPHDVRTLSDKITNKGEEARKEYKSDNERRVGEARKAGETYIRDATTISSNLLAFDQVAKQVQAEQAFRFSTEAIGLEDAGKINELARMRTKEARQALAEKLSFEGNKFYPLTKYQTREQVSAAYQAGEFGQVGSYEARTKSDNMIYLLDFIGKLTQAGETRAVESIAGQAAEAKPKDTRKMLERVLPSAAGGKPKPTQPPAQSFSEPVKKAAQELYPGVPLSELAGDDAKVKAITERAADMLRGTK